jgi:hypothetical protein
MERLLTTEEVAELPPIEPVTCQYHRNQRVPEPPHCSAHSTSSKGIDCLWMTEHKVTCKER